MMVAGFRGTLYRSYEFPFSPLARYECAMCEQQNLAKVGRIPRGGFHPLLAPRDPGQTNDGQFTSNRKNFLKLGLKWAKGGIERGASLGSLRIIPGIREGFISFQEASPKVEGWMRPLALALRFYYYLLVCWWSGVSLFSRYVVTRIVVTPFITIVATWLSMVTIT